MHEWLQFQESFCFFFFFFQLFCLILFFLRRLYPIHRFFSICLFIICFGQRLSLNSLSEKTVLVSCFFSCDYLDR